MNTWLGSILNLVFPPKCEICHKSSESALCSECFSSIKFMKPQMGIYAVSVYDGILREAIHKFKFKNKKRLIEPLGILLARYLCYTPHLQMKNVDIIIPVPLHIKRLRNRGFNHAMFLAQVLQKYFGLPAKDDIIERIRDTKPQFDLTRKERFSNVKGAFRVILPQQVVDKNVLLVDDIFTTGSTITECNKVLKLAGAKKVEVVVLSRAKEI